MNIWLNGVIIICLLLTLSGHVSASETNLTLGHSSVDDNVSVILENNSRESVAIKSIAVSFLGKQFIKSAVGVISPTEKQVFNFKVSTPALPGSYPLTASVTYLNGINALSLKHTALFHYKRQAPMDILCRTENALIDDEGTLTVKSDRPELIELILPNEIQVVSSQTMVDQKIFHIRSTIGGFRNKYPFFAVAQEAASDVHRSALCSGILVVGASSNQSATRGKAPTALLVALSVASLFAFICSVTLVKSSPAYSALAKYSSRVFFASFLYITLRHCDEGLALIRDHITFDWGKEYIELVIGNFRGPNYDYFFRYFADYYFIAIILLGLPYFFLLDNDKTGENDKYTSALRSIISSLNLLRARKMYWTQRSKLGFLTIAVKLFYIPYLTSWAINNTIHQTNLTVAFEWNFAFLNGYLVALFIFIDTLLFAFGYVVESKHLKNEIKSVEPTFLGWLVCLWCYPPFNAFSFRIFDYQFLDITYLYPNWIKNVMTALITILWGIFAWASFGIGVKASNLTNRGIVANGPYRFVRHPAYSAKLLIWLIMCIFFNQYTTGIILGFIAIYILRAWTEERHLSRDPEYIKYKKIVKWKMIPGVI